MPATCAYSGIPLTDSALDCFSSPCTFSVAVGAGEPINVVLSVEGVLLPCNDMKTLPKIAQPKNATTNKSRRRRYGRLDCCRTTGGGGAPSKRAPHRWQNCALSLFCAPQSEQNLYASSMRESFLFLVYVGPPNVSAGRFCRATSHYEMDYVINTETRSP